MKKIFAAIGASALGVVGATAVAAPAQAAPLPDCTTVADHTLSETAVNGDDWYMDCTPLYGMGKAEFTINSDIDFPADFNELSDPAVTATTNVGSDMAAYVAPATTTLKGQFWNMGAPSIIDPTRTRYTPNAVLKIGDITAIDSSALPVGCADGDYGFAYRVDYLPTQTTFSQTIDGEDWTYVVPVDSEPLYLGFSVTGAPAAFDEAAPACVAVGEEIATGATSADDGWEAVVVAATVALEAGVSLSPFSPDFGDIERFVAPVAPVEPAPAATLPATGQESLPLVLGAGGLLALGGLLFMFGRGRRGSRSGER